MDIWPRLFSHFGLPYPNSLFRYSMDVDQTLPAIPAYFNLGFVALNESALSIFRRRIFEVEDEIMRVADTFMRCQIACTLIAYAENMEINLLPAAYNCPNDQIHFQHNALAPEGIRVVHYLRADEIDRSKIFLPQGFEDFLSATLRNPVNECRVAASRPFASTLLYDNSGLRNRRHGAQSRLFERN